MGEEFKWLPCALAFQLMLRFTACTLLRVIAGFELNRDLMLGIRDVTFQRSFSWKLQLKNLLTQRAWWSWETHGQKDQKDVEGKMRDGGDGEKNTRSELYF